MLPAHNLNRVKFDRIVVALAGTWVFARFSRLPNVARAVETSFDIDDILSQSSASRSNFKAHRDAKKRRSEIYIRIRLEIIS
jgi:hypothetical protein